MHLHVAIISGDQIRRLCAALSSFFSISSEYILPTLTLHNITQYRIFEKENCLLALFIFNSAEKRECYQSDLLFRIFIRSLTTGFHIEATSVLLDKEALTNKVSSTFTHDYEKRMGSKIYQCALFNVHKTTHLFENLSFGARILQKKKIPTTRECVIGSLSRQ